MTTDEFISVLETDHVIDADLARQLQDQASDGGAKVTPHAILKLLVKTEVITQWKSEELAALIQSYTSVTDESEILDLQPLPEEDDEDRGSSRGAKSAIDASGPPPGPFDEPRTDSSRSPLFSSKATRLSEGPEQDDFPAGPAAGKGVPKGVYKLGGEKKKKGKKRTAGGKNQWDSPLLLLGGGALAILVIGGAILYYLLIRESADAVMADAKNLFDSGAYRQASARYDQFVKQFPNHKDVSEARVRMEMSKLWDVVESSPAAALPETKRVIGAIEDQPAFTSGVEGDAKQELGALLVRIGKALVEEAEKTTDQKQLETIVEQLDAVLALSANDKYVPVKARNDAELAAIAESREVIRARQKRDERLATTLSNMDAALAASDTAAAYKERLALLADYPALAEDETLSAKVLATSAAEQARVKFVAGKQAAETVWPPQPVVAELALAERLGGGAAGGGSNDSVVIRVDGALYGLRSGDGSLLWRRFAGFGAAGAPLVINGDVVAANLRDGELWRLNATTGKLVWRLPLGDKVTGVVTAGARLLATSASGKLFVVDAEQGALVGHVEFAQPIRTAPVLNDRGDRIYLAAKHSILYTLAADDLSCVGVYYSGHAAGAIAAPPVSILNKVIVADNSGSETCRLRVLSVDDDGAIDGEIASERLNGLVLTPLARAARRIAAATTVGQIAVVEISGAKDAAALSVVARREGHDAQPTARFALIHDGLLWLAGKQLMALAILPTESQLSVRSLDQDFNGDAFDDALQGVGPLVIHVRRPAGRAGVVVAATNAKDNRVAWQTELAVPLAGPPAVLAAQLRVTAVAASGAAYVLDRAALARGVQDKADRATAPVAGEPPLTTSRELGEGGLAAAAIGGTQLNLVQPDNARQVVTAVDLGSPVSCPLSLWNDRIVIPTDDGRVLLLDAATGEAVAAPFLPELTPDRKIHWLRPAVAGEGEASQLLIADSAETLYRIAEAAEPTPHLAAEKSIDVGPSPLISPLATTATHVYGGSEDGRLVGFALPELKPEEPLELGGRVVWGPHAVDKGLLLATDADEIILVGADGEIRWRQDLKHGKCGGEPLVVGDSILVLQVEGGLARIGLADGAEAGYADIGQPAVAGPVPLGERVVVAAADGSLLVVNRP